MLVNHTGLKIMLLVVFLKIGSQFLYLRRYENEIESVFERDKNNSKDFFNDIRKKYEKHELVAKNRKFFIDGNCFGFAKRLTEAQDLKSGGRLRKY